MRNDVLGSAVRVERKRLDEARLLLSLSRLPPHKCYTQKYAAWLEWAARSLKTQARIRLCGPVDLVVRMEERRGGAKASNAIAAVEAALTGAGLVLCSDAAQLRSVTLVWTRMAGITLEIARAR